MNSAMVEDALFSVVFAFAVGLRPVEAVQFGVAFAARAGDAREVGFGLDEEFVAVAAFDPAVVRGAEEGGGEVEVARRPHGAALAIFFVVFGVFCFDFGGGLDAGDGLVGGGGVLEVAAAAFAGGEAAA